MNNGLLDALKEIGWSDLPQAIGKGYKKKWIKAIVKVRKYSGVESYCLAVNDGNDKPRIIRDFGPTAIIAEILSIHPYEEAGKNIIPRFTSDEQIIKYFRKSDYSESEIASLLSTKDKSPEQIESDRRQINGYIEHVAMRQAKAMSDAEDDARKLSEMADPELKEKKAKARKYGKTAPRKTKRSKG